MRVLALNTAFKNSDVAVLQNDKKDYISLNSSAKQSENVLVCVDKLLNNNNLDIRDVDVLSVVVGPGSFTGIRIGVGLVKGMYNANKKIKLVSICSLDLMAHIYSVDNKPNNDFWCLLDALSGNIFVCKYNKYGERIIEPKMLNQDTIDEVNGDIVGLKDDNLELCSTYINFSPEKLLSYTMKKIETNNFVPENLLLPIYLRKSQAEMGLIDANKKN